jgi:tetratricopeptide (TPR) repeat protein
MSSTVPPNNTKALDDYITNQRQVVKLATDISHPDLAKKLNDLGRALATRFDQLHAEDDIAEALEVGARAVRIAGSTGDPNLGACLDNVQSYLVTSRRLIHSNEHKPSTAPAPVPAPNGIPLSSLETLFYFMKFLAIAKASFGTDPDIVGLDQVINNRRAEVKSTPEDDITYAINLDNLGNSLISRFEERGGIGDLEEAVSSYRRAVQSSSEVYPKFHRFLNNLGISLTQRFNLLGGIKDLNEGLSHQLHALRLADKGDPVLKKYLTNIGNSYLARFTWIGNEDDLHEAVSYQRRAVQMTPVGDPGRPSSLNNLGLALVKSFECFGDVKDLEEALTTHRWAVEAAPRIPRHLDRLGVALLRYFEKFGAIRDLDDAISSHQRAIACAHSGHPKLHIYFNNLSICLVKRYENLGELKDQDEAISLQRQAIQLAPDGYQDLSAYLTNLGASLIRRNGRLGLRVDFNDLEEAISCFRGAVLLMPEDYPNIHRGLHSLCAALISRYDHLDDLKDLEEAISHQRRVTEYLRRSNHPDLPLCATQLSLILSKRFDRLRDPKDFDEAINTQRQATLSISKSNSNRPMFLANLANILTRGRLVSGGADTIDEVISCFQESVRLTPLGRSEQAIYQSRLGHALMVRFQLSDNKDDFHASISAMRESRKVPFGSLLSTLNDTLVWTTGARFADELAIAMEGYETYISVVPQLAWIGQSAASRQKIIQMWRLPTMTADAASCAIELGDFERAVEILDKGRSVFWGQALGFRTDLAALQQADSTLAAELDAVAGELEPSSVEDPSAQEVPVTTGVDRDISIARRHRAAEKWDTLVSRVRKIPGFENFLGPAPFSELRLAASKGPVILINVSPYRCDALIVTLNDPVQLVPLPDTSFFQLTSLAEDLRQGESTKSPDDFQRLDLGPALQTLWDTIVMPIFERLGYLEPLIKSSSKPRVWWCPTGPLTFLPIHAAGPYARGKGPDASKRVVSSYTSTLGALVRARSPSLSTPAGITAIGLAETPNHGALPSASAEIRLIQRHASASGSLFHVLEGPDVTVENVLAALKKSGCIHFACHGMQDRYNPLNSGLALHDGPLRLSTIISTHLGQANFAFLSACHTASGSDQIPDEAMHLAAALQFVGFRSVIATMWGMSDEAGPAVAEKVYEDLLIPGSPDKFDSSGAALALHKGVSHIRKQKSPLYQWVPFIHMGV